MNASIIGVRMSAHLERLRIGIWSLIVIYRKTSRKKEKYVDHLKKYFPEVHFQNICYCRI